MKKKVNIKKVAFITLLVLLDVAFVAALTFGAISAFATDTAVNIEKWYFSTFDKELTLFKTSIVTLIVTAVLLVFTLTFEDFKKKFIEG